jgi:hypothetical protein
LDDGTGKLAAVATRLRESRKRHPSRATEAFCWSQVERGGNRRSAGDADGRCGELVREGNARVARAQKLSFGAAEGMCANQVVGGAKVKCECGADNFCLLRERKWIAVKSGGLFRGANSLGKSKGRANHRMNATWLIGALFESLTRI